MKQRQLTWMGSTAYFLIKSVVFVINLFVCCCYQKSLAWRSVVALYTAFSPQPPLSCAIERQKIPQRLLKNSAFSSPSLANLARRLRKQRTALSG
jgi:hypothetical protein